MMVKNHTKSAVREGRWSTASTFLGESPTGLSVEFVWNTQA
jgi:hypothetical protein